MSQEAVDRLREMAKTKATALAILGESDIMTTRTVDLVPEAAREKMLESHPELNQTMGESMELDVGFLTLAANVLDGTESFAPEQVKAIRDHLAQMAESSEDFAGRQEWELEKYDSAGNLYEEYENEDDDDVDDPDSIRDGIEEARDDARFLRDVVGYLTSP